MKRFITLALVVLVLGAAAFVATRDVALEVETRPVTRGPLVVTLDEEGRTRVAERYVVFAPLDGLLHRVELDPGDDVVAGETVLARVEPLPPALLDARSVATAESRVAAAEANVVRTEQVAGTAAELLSAADADLARLERAGQAVSAQQLADARREVLFRRGELATSGAARRAAEAELQVARAALIAVRPRTGSAGEGGESTADVLSIHAPISGRVLRIVRESEGPVRIGEPLVELGDTSRLEIVADYLTAEAVRMRPGMEARVTDWGGGEVLEARVGRVEPAARTKVSSLGVEEQRVDVVLDLVDPSPNAAALADGFRVQVEVVVWRGADILRVPESALVRTNTGWSAFVVRDDVAHEVAVELGHSDGRSAEVLGGLAENDEVVVYPSDLLEDGSRTKPR